MPQSLVLILSVFSPPYFYSRVWIDGNKLLTFSYETICLHMQFLWIGLSVMYDLDGTEVVKKVICIQLMKAETYRLKKKKKHIYTW